MKWKIMKDQYECLQWSKVNISLSLESIILEGSASLITHTLKQNKNLYSPILTSQMLLLRKFSGQMRQSLRYLTSINICRRFNVTLSNHLTKLTVNGGKWWNHTEVLFHCNWLKCIVHRKWNNEDGGLPQNRLTLP